MLLGLFRNPHVFLAFTSLSAFTELLSFKVLARDHMLLLESYRALCMLAFCDLGPCISVEKLETIILKGKNSHFLGGVLTLEIPGCILNIQLFPI